jgi:hypothetical protein
MVLHERFTKTFECLKAAVGSLEKDPDFRTRYWGTDLIDKTATYLKDFYGIKEVIYSSRLTIFGDETVLKLDPCERRFLDPLLTQASSSYQNINERRVVETLPNYSSMVPELISKGDLFLESPFGTELVFTYNEYEMVDPISTWIDLPRDQEEYIKNTLISHGSYWVETDPIEHWGIRKTTGERLLVDFG